MPIKRKAQEAFGQVKAPLSAFAAARLAKEAKTTPAQDALAGSWDDEDARIANLDTLDDSVAVEAFSLSSVEDVAEDGGPVVNSPVANVVFSTCRRHAVSTGDNGELTIGLSQDESVVCVGIFEMRVRQGLATIYGVTLSSKQDAARIYAPSTHALPRIVARSNATVIELRHVRSSLRKLEKVSPLFRNVWTGDKQDNTQSFTLIFSAADDGLKRSLVTMELDRHVEAALGIAAHHARTTSSPTRVMAVGAKSSGKSTLNRILCNMIATEPESKKVLYLDADPGQPEFGPPGLLSLVELSGPNLGPSFTHVVGNKSHGHRILRAHAFANTTFRDDPAHYVACVRDLLDYAGRSHPLIINLAGWVSGLGADVLVELAVSFQLSHLISLEPLDSELAHALESALPSGSVHRVQRQPVRPSTRTPAQLRSMQTMAYFHSRINTACGTPRWSTIPLPNVRPWIVSYDNPGAGIVSILSYGQSPSEKFLAEVLEGTVVALAVCANGRLTEAFNLGKDDEDREESEVLQSHVRRSPEGLPYLLDDSLGCSLPLKPGSSHCFGLALVRAIDTDNKKIHLVTPLSENELASIVEQPVCLIRGAFDPPDWAYLEDLYSGDEHHIKERPWVSRKEPVGIEGAVWRLRHPPMAADVLKAGG